MGRKHCGKRRNCPFSFSHSVFKRPVLQTHKNQGLFGKGLITTFQLLSATSLNLGLSQSGVLRNGLTLLNDKILDQSVLKAFADNKLKVIHMAKFSSFPTMFSKGFFFFRVLRSTDCVVGIAW